MEIVPGKKLLALLNQYLQSNYKIALSSQAIVTAFNQSDVPEEMVELLQNIERFRIALVS